MPRHVFTDDMAEITGYGGELEQQCRNAVAAGIEWLEDHPTAQPVVKSSGFAAGMYEANPDARALEKEMGKHLFGDSAATMQSCLGHVLYAFKHGGWEGYMAESKRRK